MRGGRQRGARAVAVEVGVARSHAKPVATYTRGQPTDQAREGAVSAVWRRAKSVQLGRAECDERYLVRL